MIPHEMTASGPREAHPCGSRSRPTAFWLVLDGEGSPLILPLPDGSGAAARALFSGEEEARMFCALEEPSGGLRVRETSAGEVVSLLYCSWVAADRLALDPTPEMLESHFLALLTLDRRRFVRRFLATGDERGG